MEENSGRESQRGARESVISNQQMLEMLSAMSSPTQLPFSGPRGNEISSNVASGGGGGLVDQIYNLAMPLIAPPLASSTYQLKPGSFSIMPSISPGQGVAEAYYASTVTSRMWAESQTAFQQMAMRGIGRDVGGLFSRVGIAGALGLSPEEMGEGMAKLGTQAAGAPLISQGVAALLSNPITAMLAGGQMSSPFAATFASRRWMGTARGSIDNLYDLDAQESSRKFMEDVGRSLATAIRGDGDGGLSLVQNMGFTRGFRDEDISRIFSTLSDAGAFGDVGKMRSDSAGYSQLVEGIKDKTGQFVEVFSALSDITGSRDMRELMSSLETLTAGTVWQKLDPNQLKTQLRHIEATAQALDVSKKEMLNTVQTVQRTIQGALGVTADQISMGYGGNTLGAATDMAQHVYGVARHQGVRDPASMRRISMQQQGLLAMGLQSELGRFGALYEYMGQEGQISQDDLAALRNTMRTGTPAEKAAAMRDFFVRRFGSTDEGYRLINDEMSMRQINENLLDPGRTTLHETIRAGQIGEIRDHTLRSSTEALDRAVTSAMGQFGLTPEVIFGGAAEARYTATLGYLEEQGDEHAQHIRKIIEDGKAAGKTDGEIEMAVNSYVQSNDRLRAQHGPGINRARADAAAANKYRNFSENAENFARTGALMQSLRANKVKIGSDIMKAAERGDYATVEAYARSQLSESQYATAMGDVDYAGGRARAAVGSVEALATVQERLQGMEDMSPYTLASETSRYISWLDRVAAGTLDEEGIGKLKEFLTTSQVGFTDDVDALMASLGGEGGAKLAAVLAARERGVLGTGIMRDSITSSRLGLPFGYHEAVGEADAARGTSIFGDLSTEAMKLAAVNMAFESSELADLRRGALGRLVGYASGKTGLSEFLGVVPSDLAAGKEGSAYDRFRELVGGEEAFKGLDASMQGYQEAVGALTKHIDASMFSSDDLQARKSIVSAIVGAKSADEAAKLWNEAKRSAAYSDIRNQEAFSSDVDDMIEKRRKFEEESKKAKEKAEKALEGDEDLKKQVTAEDSRDKAIRDKWRRELGPEGLTDLYTYEDSLTDEQRARIIASHKALGGDAAKGDMSLTTRIKDLVDLSRDSSFLEKADVASLRSLRDIQEVIYEVEQAEKDSRRGQMEVVGTLTIHGLQDQPPLPATVNARA